MKRTAWVVCAVAALCLVAAAAQAENTAVGYRDSVIITAPGPGETAADAVVKRKLAVTIVSFTFNEQPLEEALDFLATLGHVNIVVDRRGVEPGKTITLKLDNAALETAVKLVAEQAGVRWVVRDGVVLVTNEEGAKSEPITLVHDVSDLISVVPNFEGPDIELGSIGARRGGETSNDNPFGNPGQPETAKAEVEKSREELLEELVDIIRTTIDPGTWDQP